MKISQINISKNKFGALSVKVYCRPQERTMVNLELYDADTSPTISSSELKSHENLTTLKPEDILIRVYDVIGSSKYRETGQQIITTPLLREPCEAITPRCIETDNSPDESVTVPADTAWTNAINNAIPDLKNSYPAYRGEQKDAVISPIVRSNRTCALAVRFDDKNGSNTIYQLDQQWLDIKELTKCPLAEKIAAVKGAFEKAVKLYEAKR